MRENWQSSLLKKQYDPFLEHYLKLYQENPRSRVFAPLAEAYRKSGLVDEAIDICQEGLSYYPNFISGIVALARSLFDKGLYNKAISELEKVVSEVPDNYLVQKILAESYLKIGDKNNGLKAYKMVLFLNPADAEIAKIVEELENQNNNEDRENLNLDIKIEEPAVTAVPPFPTTGEEKKQEDSVPDFKVPELSPDSIELNFFEEKRAADAFGDIQDNDEDTKVITEFSTLTMGELLEQQGMKTQALEVYSKLLEQNPGNKDLKNKIEKLSKELAPPVEPEPLPPMDIEIPELKIPGPVETKEPVEIKITAEPETPYDDEWLYPNIPQKKNNTAKIEKLKKILEHIEEYRQN
jgi:tetratricopeptide (TPR) repeat protein